MADSETSGKRRGVFFVARRSWHQALDTDAPRCLKRVKTSTFISYLEDAARVSVREKNLGEIMTILVTVNYICAGTSISDTE
jgi:hypothetical protein